MRILQISSVRVKGREKWDVHDVGIELGGEGLKRPSVRIELLGAVGGTSISTNTQGVAERESGVLLLLEAEHNLSLSQSQRQL